jgi:hypothetical protein
LDSVLLPSITPQAGGRDLMLQPAQLLDHNTGSQSWFGSLGVDLLHPAGSVTMDFGAITLTLQ